MSSDSADPVDDHLSVAWATAPIEATEAPPSQGGRPVKTCYQRAIDLLSRRAHFAAELRTKLRQRDFETDEVEATLERLRQERYVDDDATSRLWVEQQLRRKAQGPRKLLAGLLRRGVERDLAFTVVQEEADPLEDDLCRAAAERWRARSRGDRNALKRHLERLGFRAAPVVRALKRFESTS